MRRFPPSQRKKSRIEIIPMIDVMMFLLVFFVLIGLNVIPDAGLKLKLPLATNVAALPPPTRMIVSLPPDGPIEVDGVPIGSASALQTIAAERTRTAVGRLSVIVKGDQTTPVQKLVEVIDALKAAGVDALSIATNKP